jgi:carbonic anhydrase
LVGRTVGVKAAVDHHGESLGPNLDYLVRAIQPAVRRTAGDRDQIKAAILANVQNEIGEVMESSAIVREHAEANALQVVGAYYELESGRVTFTVPPAVRSSARTSPGERTLP